MIKLTPEHVGGRLVLSDDTVHFVTHMTDTHYWLTEMGIPDESLILKLDGLDDDDGQLIQCLLDAPNPLDVEVPEWVDPVMLWSTKGRFFRPTGFYRREDWKEWTYKQIIGWSPAPGQMPPREDV